MTEQTFEKKRWFMQAKKRDPANKRNIRIQVSVSSKDKELLKKQADEVDLHLAEYMYFVLMNKKLHVLNTEFSKTLRDIAGESKNLNIIANTASFNRWLNQSQIGVLRQIVDKLNKLIVQEVETLLEIKTDVDKRKTKVE